MTVSTTVLADGSVTVTDQGVTHAPLSPEAVQAIAAQAATSAAACNSQQLAEGLVALAQLITAAAPLAGADAYAQVTVTPGHAAAVVDAKSFALLTDTMPGKPDGSGGWVAGPVTVTPKPADPPPDPAPVPDPVPDPAPTPTTATRKGA